MCLQLFFIYTKAASTFIKGKENLIAYLRKNLSTACAAPRPSAIAHTTRLCPRRASPAAKTPGTLVTLLLSSAAMLPLGAVANLNSSISHSSLPTKPIAKSTSCADTLAGSRADVRCKFREIIGFIQTGIGIIIHPMVNKIIEFRHQIMQRTA